MHWVLIWYITFSVNGVAISPYNTAAYHSGGFNDPVFYKTKEECVKDRDLIALKTDARDIEYTCLGIIDK